MENAQDGFNKLLSNRSNHYAAFPLHVETDHLTPSDIVWRIMQQIGWFRTTGMGTKQDVFSQTGILSKVGELLGTAGVPDRMMVVSDAQVAPFYLERVVQSLRGAGITVSSFVIPGGESSKTLNYLSQLWEVMLQERLNRKSALLALGGGVVSDLAGFAAATFMRGIRWAAVPASLLGMVDASLGGKTGIDLPQGKNLVGAFHPPCLVLVDIDLLSTLPEAEWRNGLAEVVKAAVIASPSLFTRLSGCIPQEIDWQAVIRSAIAIKLRIVEEDPLELGKRVLLNYGHTIGHALEHASHYQMRHGEAVAIGMIVEAQIGEQLGITQPGTADKIEGMLAQLGLPTRIPPDLKESELRSALAADKKHDKQKIIFPVLVAIGNMHSDFEIEEVHLWHLFLSCMARP
jgi:3-dehydroquinate synthase